MSRYSIELIPTLPIADNLAYVMLSEKAGLEYVWVADDSPAPMGGDVFVTLSAIAGAPEDCIRLIREQTARGVSHFMFGPPFGPNPKESIRLLGEEVVKPLKSK